MEKKELERWYDVYRLYKDTPYICIIEEYLEELLEQSSMLNEELLTINYNVENKIHLTINDVIKISKDFLGTINPNYSDDLEFAITHGHVEFYCYDDEYDRENNKSKDGYRGAYFTINLL